MIPRMVAARLVTLILLPLLIFAFPAASDLAAFSAGREGGGRPAPDLMLDRPGDGETRVEARLRARVQLQQIVAMAGPQFVQAIVEATEPARAAQEVEQGGGVVEGRHGPLLQVRLPVSAFSALAASPSILSIRAPLQATVAGTESEALTNIGVPPWRANGYEGAGVSVAVLDRGFAGYQRLLGGELPSSVQVRSFRADGDLAAGESHGTAMSEVVHDVAPRAALLLVNFETEVEFANAVDYAIAQNASVVVSGVNWFNAGPGDGTGFIDSVAQKATGAGIVWVNSAGDSARRHWSGTFVDARGKGWNNFTPDSPPDLAWELNKLGVISGQRALAFLSWDDWSTVDQDYDLYLFRGDCAGGASPCVVAAYSNNTQNGGAGQQPTEAIDYSVPADDTTPYWLAIRRASATRAVYLQLFSAQQTLMFATPARSLLAPADAPAILALGATALADNSVRPYSAQGPTSDGRIKPDLSAPDAVSTTTYGAAGFGGTSAAAAHAGGAAALVREAFPAYGVGQVRTFLSSRALDLGAAGPDSQSGAGLLQLGAAPSPHLSAEPSALAFIWQRGSEPPPARTVQVRVGAADWTASSSAAWLQVAPSSDSGSATVTASIATAGLAPGIYSGELRLQAPDSVEESIVVPVRLIVGDRIWKMSLPIIRKEYSGGW